MDAPRSIDRSDEYTKKMSTPTPHTCDLRASCFRSQTGRTLDALSSEFCTYERAKTIPTLRVPRCVHALCALVVRVRTYSCEIRNRFRLARIV
ncbi:hypothetical protein EVAR_42578_1 [Eumeta japonica]|uniref:Uncharacterized protein n=1 Tax=Eumeta variegata TaxID=151549 RepID=A0A4C1ZVI8_EUMVA|nr:hypothetical protein EVAR_42578_1 [Eumeta japonica]